MDLDKLVKEQAQKSGISQKEASKALKKLKQGGMMAQIAPQLQQSFMEMNPNLTARDKLRQKIANGAANRRTKYVKVNAYERQKKQVAERKEKEELVKQQKRADLERKRQEHKLELERLEQSLGVVSEDLYIKCLEKVQLNPDDTNANNIIDLYTLQQEFKQEIDLSNDFNELL